MARRIGERAEQWGVTLAQSALPSLAEHLLLLRKWNRTIRLMSSRDAEGAIDRHVLESVVAAGEVDSSKGRLLDVGSGNGYPGIVMKILHPELPVTLLEPALRKSVFLGEVGRALGLMGMDVRRERIEHPRDVGRFAPLGSITMRAVAVLNALLPGAAQALVPGGRALLFLGSRQAEALKRALPTDFSLVQSKALPGRSRAELTILERRG